MTPTEKQKCVAEQAVYGDWRWDWRGQPLNNGFFGCNRWAHTAGEGSNSIVVGDSELHFWEVVSLKINKKL